MKTIYKILISISFALGILTVFGSAYAKTSAPASTPEITTGGQIVDSITYRGVKTDAVYTPYRAGLATDWTYGCFVLPRSFYANVYGITVSNLVSTTAVPKASKGVFTETRTPRKGDIVRNNLNGVSHWMLVKEVNGSTVTLIQQNAYAKDNTCAQVGVTVDASDTSVSFFTYSDYLPDNDVPVTGIETWGKVQLEVGETTQWRASVIPADATEKSLWWAAGNPGVATVDQNGNIKAHKPGKCNISVTAKNGVQKIITVTVTAPVSEIKTAGRTKISVGETVRWTAAPFPVGSWSGRLFWVAGNPGVATVDQFGNITAHKPGKCNITVSAGYSVNSVRKTVLLTVVGAAAVPVTGLQTAGKTKLTVGETVKWTASVLPVNATDKSLWWASGNPGVATVDQNGNITAHKAGQCHITIFAGNNLKKTFLVTVKKPATKNTVLLYGEVFSFIGYDARGDAHNATGLRLSPESSRFLENKERKEGNYGKTDEVHIVTDLDALDTIDLKQYVGKYVAVEGEVWPSCSPYHYKDYIMWVSDIEVKAPATGISTAGKTRLTVGERVRWTAAVTPANATNQRLTWVSTNPDIAAVDQNGNITAHKAGQCHITIFAGNNVKKTFLVTVSDKKAASVSGSCGKGVTWALNENTGVLTVSGNGAMDDYYMNMYNDKKYDQWSTAPWWRYRHQISRVVIENGVTHVGNHAFASLDNNEDYATLYDKLQSVSIAGSVKSIGDNAFSLSTALTELRLSEGLQTIGDSAFWECYNLSSFNIPNTVTSIGDDAFMQIPEVTSVTIPYSVQKIGKNALGFFMSQYQDPPPKVDGFTIRGYAGTAGERYAKSNGFPFADIS